MIPTLHSFWENLVSQVKQRIRQWTRPATLEVAAAAISDLARSRADLIAENALLRQHSSSSGVRSSGHS